MNKAKRLPISLEKAGHKIALEISKGGERAYPQGQIDDLDWVTEILWGDPDEWENRGSEEDESIFEESEMFLKGEAQHMKKQDLQNFDIIETRAGNLYMVNADSGVFFGTYGWASLENYKDDLTAACICEGARNYEVLRVRRPNKEYQHICGQWGEAPIIWERDKKPELSHEEEVVLRALNKPDWWIARDPYGLYLYEKKPVYEGEWWGSSGVNMPLYDHLFDFVEKGKDCYQVKDLLRDGEGT